MKIQVTNEITWRALSRRPLWFVPIYHIDCWVGLLWTNSIHYWSMVKFDNKIFSDILGVKLLRNNIFNLVILLNIMSVNYWAQLTIPLRAAFALLKTNSNITNCLVFLKKSLGQCCKTFFRISLKTIFPRRLKKQEWTI